MMCPATKAAGARNFADARPHVGWSKEERSIKEYLDYLEEKGLDLKELSLIPGWHTHNFFEDELHCDGGGVRQHGNGSLLVDLSEAGHFGPKPSAGSGLWHERLDCCLRVVTTQFQSWLGANRISCSQPDFNHLSLTMHSKTDFPVLKAKARNSITVTQWLLSKVTPIALANPADERG